MISKRNYSPRSSLFFYALMFASVFSTGVQATDMLNSRHQILWSSANSHVVSGTRYIQGGQFNGKILADYQSLANLKNQFVMQSAYVHFFKPGVTFYGGDGEKRVGSLQPSSVGQPPATNLNIKFDFRSICGQSGALVTVVTLKNKYNNDYISFHQGAQPVPHSGGVDPVVIDCARPQLNEIAGQSAKSFNNVCLADLYAGKRSTELALKMSDDTGIAKVEVKSNNPALVVTPGQATGSDITQAGKLFLTRFQIKATNTQAVNGIEVRVEMTDFSGKRQSSSHTLSLAGAVEGAVNVTLNAMKPIVPAGTKMFFGGHIDTDDCELSTRRSSIQWEIHKVSAKTVTQGTRVSHGQFNMAGKRTPFIVPFQTNAAGLYRMRLLDVSRNMLIYVSPPIEIMPVISGSKAKAITSKPTSTNQPAMKPPVMIGR